jgi:hypothetical protein
VQTAFKESSEAQNLKDFEKSFGMRIKKLCNEDEGNRFSRLQEQQYMGDEYLDDVQEFSQTFKTSFIKYREEFRNVMYSLREKEYQTFASLGLERAKTADQGVYDRINQKKELLKQRIQMAGATNPRVF